MKTIIPTNWVTWNISNCEISTVLTGNNQSPLNLIDKKTYTVYNKCDNSIVSTYDVHSIWTFTIILVILWLIVYKYFLPNKK